MCNALAFAAVQASGQYGQGRVANMAAQTEADQLDWQAGNAEDDGRMQARRIRRAGAAARGETLAAVAASGVKVGEGSALDAERQVMEDYATDEYMAILNGRLRGAGLRLSANNARRAGRDAARAGKINAFTSLMEAGAAGARSARGRRMRINDFEPDGYTGSNDQSVLSRRSPMSWFMRNGSSGD